MKKNRVVSGLLAVAMTLSVLGTSPSVTVMAAAPEELQAGTNYRIISKQSRKALTVEGYSTGNGAKLCQMTANDYVSQIWTLKPDGSGAYQIVNKYSGKVLDVPNSSTDEGIVIQQYNEGNADNKKWLFSDEDGDGYCRITPKLNTEFALGVEGASADNGAKVAQRTYTGADNQEWLLEPVTMDEINLNPEYEQADPQQAAEQYLKKFFYTEEKDGKTLGRLRNQPSNGFWTDAEILETFLDAYEQLKDAKYLTAAEQFYDGIIDRKSADWEWNEYNDDVMWMVIATARLYLNTKDLSGKDADTVQSYLDVAKANFDMTYDRAWSDDLGGGLWWTTDKNEKNACVNGPGAIAACLLGEATEDSSYYTKAINIFEWEKETLFNADNGAVKDNINKNGEFNTWASTYNQGTFIGAAAMLYKHETDATKKEGYLATAKQAAGYAARMGDGNEGYLNREQNSGDLIGFKGILGRWMGYLARECNVTDYDAWMIANAKAAWNNRNSDDLMWTEFGRKTVEKIENSDEIFDSSSKDTKKNFAAWGCSAAVAWLVNSPKEPLQYPYILLEAEAGEVSGGAKVKAEAAASNGYYVGDIGAGNGAGAVTFKINVTTAGTYTVKLYSITGATRDMSIVVNGNDPVNVSCASNGSWTAPTWTPATGEIALTAGENTIQFKGNGTYGPNLDRIALELTEDDAQGFVNSMIADLPDAEDVTDADRYLVTAVKKSYDSLQSTDKVTNIGKLDGIINTAREPVKSFVVEAELAELSGGAEFVSVADASNGYHIGNVGVNGGTAAFRVNANTAGNRTLKVYFTTAQQRKINVIVNKKDSYELSCTGTSWSVPNTEPQTTVIALKRGENLIELTGAGTNPAPNIDRIELALTDAEAQQFVDDMIAALPDAADVTENDIKFVTAVKLAYDALTEKDALTGTEKLAVVLNSVDEIEAGTKKYKVSFDSNGGSAVNFQEIIIGQKATKPAEPVKEGYAFKVWKLGDTEYDFDTEVRKNITLVAEWESTETVQVNFDSAGGTAVQPQTILVGKTATEPTAPEKSGYLFEGWYHGDVSYDFTNPVTEAITLTARWKLDVMSLPLEKELAELANGAQISGNHIGFIGGEENGTTAFYVNMDTAAERTLKVYYATREERGLSVLVNGEEQAKLTCMGNSWTEPNEEPQRAPIRLRAGENVIKLAGADGKDAPNVIRIEIELTDAEAQYVVDGMIAALPDAKDVTAGETQKILAIKNAFDKLRKKNALSNAAKLESALESVTEINEGTKKYTVTFDSDGATEVLPQEITIGEKATEPETPVKEGYTFKGWYLADTAYDFAEAVNKTIKLTAKWEEIVKVTVTFDFAEGSKAESKEIVAGEKVTEPKAPVREGYIFKGWYLGEEEYDFSKEVTEAITLVAKWEKEQKKDLPNQNNQGGQNNSENQNGSNQEVNKKVKVTGIQITGISKKIAAGKKVTLKAVVTPETASNKSVKWSSSNTKYAKVNPVTGKVSTKKAGKNKKVTITATAEDGSGVTASYQIKIMPKAVKKITLKASKKTLKKNATIKVKAGKKLTLKAVVSPSKQVNKTLKWTSSNEKFATVKNGVVKTKKSAKGKTVKITAMATDGSGKKMTIKVKIVK